MVFTIAAKVVFFVPVEIVILSCVSNDKSAALTKAMVFEAIENLLNSKLFESILSCKIKYCDPSFPSKSLELIALILERKP